ncbi:hypothetical protein BDF20DRAFT_915125 [Mycotypha africana]|uniref:uncharacterized protein n=1 Tax=Mycotypha africana TaxID=64632 RepID=UPI002300DBDE|nr:uncharacterized protein BDF20DRAFT_915125 [Mycotypha africana]KAI8973720.1 hypothetical protein BDF20DRAFT_915125 [Mycotypha africana]
MAKQDNHQLKLSPPALSYFCVYNSSLGRAMEDNAANQILYYTAAKGTVSADEKMKQIGLAQALVNFTSTFSSSASAIQSVHSQKNRMVFYQPESGFWMHMCVKLGVSRKQLKDSKGKEKLATEYLDSQLNDRALEAILKVGYEQFKLLNGTFSSLVFGTEYTTSTHCSSTTASAQKIGALMHLIEQFFSEWIWKWDFNRLDTMCFTAVFNGVPNGSILRKDYLKINDLEEDLRKEIKLGIPLSHMFILHENEVLYRSKDLNIHDVCALRKYVMRTVDAYHKNSQRKQSTNSLTEMPATTNMPNLKQLAKSFTQTPLLKYLPFGTSKSTETSRTTFDHSNDIFSSDHLSEILSIAPSSVAEEPKDSRGVYLTGITESINMNDEERPHTKPNHVRVYLHSPTHLSSSIENPQNNHQLYEYYLIVYMHQSKCVWSFLLPKNEDVENLLSSPSYYASLEQYLHKCDVESLINTVVRDMRKKRQKSLRLGRKYQWFFYDNMTLDMKTSVDFAALDQKEQTAAQQPLLTNEILLHLLNIKEDFEKMLCHTNEIYSRSTSNHWIAGNRFYHASLNDDLRTIYNSNCQDYTEMYLIAAKKDSSLADVEG